MNFKSDAQRKAMWANMFSKSSIMFSDLSSRMNFAFGDDLDDVYKVYKKLRKREDGRKWIHDSGKRAGSTNSIRSLESKYLDMTSNTIPKLTNEELAEFDKYLEERYKKESENNDGEFSAGVSVLYPVEDRDLNAAGSYKSYLFTGDEPNEGKTIAGLSAMVEVVPTPQQLAEKRRKYADMLIRAQQMQERLDRGEDVQVVWKGKKGRVIR